MPDVQLYLTRVVALIAVLLKLTFLKVVHYFTTYFSFICVQCNESYPHTIPCLYISVINK